MTKKMELGKVATMTVWPSQIQASIVGTSHSLGGSVSTPEQRESVLGHIIARLIEEGVETVEIRVENADD